ncbi:MAG: FeoC-like transcriptional regulator [Candidatus Thorarchaeota archaeon]
MIERVLELIIENRIVDKNELARKVGVQVETLDDIIGLLCQRGYLREEEGSCNESPSCSGCNMEESCGSSDRLGRALFVTEKGRQFVRMKREYKK